MNMYQLKQILSEAKIRKYLRYAAFGGPQVFCPECTYTIGHTRTKLTQMVKCDTIK
jgi:hypothetical protein